MVVEACSNQSHKMAVEGGPAVLHPNNGSEDSWTILDMDVILRGSDLLDKLNN